MCHVGGVSASAVPRTVHSQDPGPRHDAVRDDAVLRDIFVLASNTRILLQHDLLAAGLGMTWRGYDGVDDVEGV